MASANITEIVPLVNYFNLRMLRLHYACYSTWTAKNMHMFYQDLNVGRIIAICFLSVYCCMTCVGVIGLIRYCKKHRLVEPTAQNRRERR